MRQGDVAASSVYKAQAHPTLPLLPFTRASGYTPTWVLICLYDVFVLSKRSVLFFCCSKLLSSEWKLKSKFLEEVSIVLHLIFFGHQNLDHKYTCEDNSPCICYFCFLVSLAGPSKEVLWLEFKKYHKIFYINASSIVCQLVKMFKWLLQKVETQDYNSQWSMCIWYIYITLITRTGLPTMTVINHNGYIYTDNLLERLFTRLLMVTLLEF